MPYTKSFIILDKDDIEKINSDRFVVLEGEDVTTIICSEEAYKEFCGIEEKGE